MRNLEDFKKEWRSFVPDTSDGMNRSAPMTWFGIVYLLDSLDTQESELTKLRKRVEVLEKALEKYALPQTRLTKKHEEEQWRLEPGFHDPQTAVEALKESAKIAAADE